MKRVVTAFGAVAGGIGLAVMTAVPSNAANLGTVTWNGTTFAGASLTGEIGDTFTLVNTGSGIGDSGSLQNDTGTAREGATNCIVNTGVPQCPSLAGSTHTYTVTQLGRLAVWNTVGMGQVAGYITISSASGSSPSALESSAPASVVQQFAKPSSGTCDAAQPSGLDWAGVASGGWGVSWAEWVNDGRGGDVCTRQLNYSPALSRWTLG